MRKRLLVLLAAGFLLAGLAGVSQAALVTIGTAQFGGSGTEYNLIWDDDNNGNSVVWLDYSNAKTNWTAQNAWAAGLDSSLIYTINPAYTVDWGTSSWRLPSTVDGAYVWGHDGTTTAGYNITTSEMGHLYYEELGNLGYYATDGTNQSGWGLNNTGDFNNLAPLNYWSGTEYAVNPDYAWYFGMAYGPQGSTNKSLYDGYGLAVRSGQVSAVPVPGAIWLLGSGLTGLAALGRRRKGNRV